MTQTIVKSNGNGRAIDAFGSRNDIRELRERLKLMVPGGSKLADNELAALAQGAIAHGLDPLNGEIWFIPGRGLMIGVKGLRKKAREQVKGNFWIDFAEITDPDTRRRYGIPDGALAFEARLFDSETLRTWSDAVALMTKPADKGGPGIPYDAAFGILGNRPFTTGIGVLKSGEQTKMERVQCAMKRAESDALKRRFDVPFGMAVEPDTEPEEVTYTGEWVESKTAPSTEAEYVPSAEEMAEMEAALKAKREADKQALYGND